MGALDGTGWVDPCPARRDRPQPGLKYGALSGAGGWLDVTSRERDGELAITWTERGGSRVLAPTRRGFGSKLVARSVAGPLGGTIAYVWRPAGVVVTLRVGRARLAD